MKITRLSVPFHQKDQAKELGAKWNSQEKFWYVSEKEDTSLFKQWLPNEKSTINLRSNSYYIAKSSRGCWKCEHNCPVYAIVLPKSRSHTNGYAKILYYLQYINEGAQKRFEALGATHYYCDSTGMASHSYWMNHCQKCTAKLGDFDTIEEYSSPFRPTSVDEAKDITLYYIEESLEAFGSSCKSVAFLECMKVVPDPLVNSHEERNTTRLRCNAPFGQHHINKILGYLGSFASKRMKKLSRKSG